MIASNILGSFLPALLSGCPYTAKVLWGGLPFYMEVFFVVYAFYCLMYKEERLKYR